jgi:hypothetical protein
MIKATIQKKSSPAVGRRPSIHSHESQQTAAEDSSLPDDSQGPDAQLGHLGHHIGGLPVGPNPANKSGNLPDPLRQKMEAAFDTDFSDVRVHEGPQPAALDAVAYAQGNDIYMNPGKYSPGTREGQELIGHELAHVVQQRAGQVARRQGKGMPINEDPALEQEADRLGALAARSGPSGPGAGDPTRAPQPAGGLSESTSGAMVSAAPASSSAAPIQLSDARKKGGFNLGKSHSTNRGKKVTSHKPGKGRTEDPSKSRAMNRKRQRQIQANVSNSQKNQ